MGSEVARRGAAARAATTTPTAATRGARLRAEVLLAGVGDRVAVAAARLVLGAPLDQPLLLERVEGPLLGLLPAAVAGLPGRADPLEQVALAGGQTDRRARLLGGPLGAPLLGRPRGRPLGARRLLLGRRALGPSGLLGR